MSTLKALFTSKKGILITAGAIVLVAASFFAIRYYLKPKAVDKTFAKYIESYTSGVISKESTIRIKLVSQVQGTHAQNEPLPDGVFSFSPSVKGKAYWVDALTIEFKPDKQLEADRSYTATFKLGKVMDLPDRYQKFEFGFQTMAPDFTLSFNGLQTSPRNSMDKMKLEGVVQTADAEQNEQVEKIIAVDYPSATHVSWQHNPYNHTHTFTLDKITRASNAATPLTINWNGDALNVKKKGSKAYEVPAVGDFRVLDIRAVQNQEQYVLVQFSDAIAVGQDLNGLIGVENTSEPSYTIDGSTVKVYTTERLDGNYNVFVNPGVENIAHQKIRKTYKANVFFENKLPAVTIPGKGVVLPSSGKLMMPFEAVNLNAVDVSIIKIYEDNVAQYFQNNDLDGGAELRRVGKPVVQKTIRLDADKSVNLNKKTRFMLDLDKLIRTEPGAIYRVIIGFRKEYSLYNCTTGGPVKSANNEEEDYYDGENTSSGGSVSDEDDDFWSRYDSYYPDGYNWSERDNPCTDSYFTKDKWATRNIIASNIGLVAKRGTDNSMVVVATDILSAQPIEGVELDLQDYQRQLITKQTTDAYGLAKFDIKRKPYLLVAKRGDERGYLKLDDGNALPLTRFDVGGDQVQSGVKGFIYGERGVWRPGDSIYVSFILEDKAKKLPPDLPVEFNFYNPEGQLYSRLVQTKSVDGFYSFHTATQTTDMTGNWTAKVKVGGAIFTKNIKVETVMPNRLKIKLDFNGQTELTKGENTGGSLNARWLFGGTAQNLKAKVDAYLSSQTTTFKGFEDYSFDDPTKTFNTQVSPVFDGNLDAEGNTHINADIEAEEQAPGQLRANFLVKVFEPGGNFSINQTSLPYNVYQGYVGVKVPKGNELTGMLVTGKDHVFDIADVDTKGNLVKGRRTVQVELYKVKWHWWWDNSGNQNSNFTQDKYNKLLKTETVTLVNGRGRWKMRIDQPDWGQYVVKVKDEETGHTTGKQVYIDWPNWAQRLQQDNPTEAAMLSFTADKKKYTVGEEAVLTIPTPANGRALISFENGTKVLKTDWVKTEKGQTQYRFKVDETMAPNVFINVTLLQPHSQTVNDLPIRMYGAIPLLVDNPATILKPVISMPDKIRPETRSQITVAESSGKEMTYTVAIVDEGLLDITNFKTPDPHEAFYAREALGVKTWDLFDYVIGAYGGDLQHILSIGGDAGGRNMNRNITVNRFKPVVKFMGPFHLNAGEKQTHAFILPQYIGAVKVMVIAGHDGSYGFADKAVSVKKPLMILATLPRVLGPTEKIQLPVTVFATENNIKIVSVDVQSNAFSNLAGNSHKTVTFTKPGDQMVNFELTVKDFIGIGKVKVVARSGSETAAYDVDLSVRNPNPGVTRVLDKELLPGESWSTSYAAVGMNGTNRTTLEESTIPSLNLAKRLNYLIEYPHGCVEQTTSAVFPQLYLGQLTNLSDGQKAMINRNIQTGIKKLAGFQLPDGGLSYWPDAGSADDWGTSYAGHFMLAAQTAGYALPIGFIEHWKTYQRQKALAWAPNTRDFYGADLVQAYRLYLLALAHAPELGAMNRLKEFPYLSVQAKWRLAAAYKLAGQPEVGLRMVAGLPLTVKPYNSMWGTYGSDLRDEAMTLETLILLGKKQDAVVLVRTIAARLSQNSWYSTQTTAYSLVAISAYCGKNTAKNKLMFNYHVGGTNGNINSDAYVSQVGVKNQSGKLSITNRGGARLFVRLIQYGQPVTGEDVKPINNPDILGMRVSYFTLKGTSVDPSQLKQGTDFVAQVTVKNPGKLGRYDNMALTQIFPSGWEILNTRMMEGGGDAFKSSESDYRDIRDDRVNTYFSLPEGKEVTYFVMLNAAYAGKYYLPAVYCDAMYNASINALAKGQWVEVVK
ncbi:MG2 domain-containing protein [Mucilaginibacter sp. RS28]|uniref:MG2 domain-containing protein n=1 Tax=Mucilaginibacter straminoryzae TaxID=2932774 RepID=A0A9X1X6Z3_9SPHI|nr:MG2 domain-containing protein [Mucilaginibacter straminoryzae]MCJ8209764.1 MG2 domain-containing protein [Mucilaginibacter straminoryzae]